MSTNLPFQTEAWSSRMRDRRRLGSGNWLVGVFFWLALTAVMAVLPARAGETNRLFHFGISTCLMPNLSEDDAGAAMKVWADRIVQEGVVHADPHVLLFNDFASLRDALRQETVDGVTASTADFFALKKEFMFNHAVFSVTGGSIFEEYVLLVHRDSGFTKLEDLRGCSLNMLQQAHTCLATVWLDTALLEQGLKPSAGFCGRVTAETKLTQAVLPVFFHKVDACVATRKGFATMCELNPQVGRELRVLTNSPNLVPSAFLFRSGFPAAEQEACLKEFTHAHLSVMGQQILTVFQTERLEERPASVLDSALELLQRHQDLLNAASERKELPGTIRPSAGKTSQATSGNGVAAAPAHQSVNR